MPQHLIQILTRDAGSTTHAKTGKGKSALKVSTTRSSGTAHAHQAAAEALLEKWYGRKGIATLTNTGKAEGNWEIWEADINSAAPNYSAEEQDQPPVAAPLADASTPELIHPGQLSKALETRLKDTASTFADEFIAQAFSGLELARSSYQVRAVLTGIVFLAKKHATKHGKWKPWLETFFENHIANVKRASHLNADSFYRTIACYMQLAKRFLWKIETDGFAHEVVESDQKRIQCTAVQILELTVKDSPEEHPLFSELHHFVAGRSLRRMLADFRQAEKDAEAERDEDPSDPSDPSDPKNEAAEPPAKPIQLLLWESYCRDTAPMLDRLFDKPGTEDLRGEEAIAYYSNIASELEERAKRARQLAEAAKEGSSKS